MYSEFHTMKEILLHLVKDLVLAPFAETSNSKKLSVFQSIIQKFVGIHRFPTTIRQRTDTIHTRFLNLFPKKIPGTISGELPNVPKPSLSVPCQSPRK